MVGRPPEALGFDPERLVAGVLGRPMAGGIDRPRVAGWSTGRSRR